MRVNIYTHTHTYIHKYIDSNYVAGTHLGQKSRSPYICMYRTIGALVIFSKLYIAL